MTIFVYILLIQTIYSSGTGESADGGNVRPIGGRKSKMRQLPVISEANTVPQGSVLVVHRGTS